jgi:hypothetical protein
MLIAHGSITHGPAEELTVVTGRDIAEWKVLRRALTRDAFASRYQHPFLLLRGGLAEEDDGLGFHTRVSTDREVAEVEHGSQVIAIVKQPNNPFQDRVSIGRATNCDIVLADVSISKLHAHFMEIGPSEAELVDRGSANGTTLNGILLKAEPVHVTSGDAIVFGSVKVEFADAGRLWDLLATF